MLDTACGRLVTTADLGIKGTPRILNMQLVKALTGNDLYIRRRRTRPRSSKLS
jgi:hypothetical protein